MTKEKTQTKEIIVDGTMIPLGRLGTFVAKKALQGNNLVVINTEKIIIIGNPKEIIEDRLMKIGLGKGNPRKPIFPREVVPFVKRTIRGMLNFKRTTGREAFKNIMCYEGIPKEYENKEIIKLESKEPLKFISIGELSKSLRQR